MYVTYVGILKDKRMSLLFLMAENKTGTRYTVSTHVNCRNVST